MATHELRNRANWQTISGKKALNAEELFKVTLQSALDEVHPKTFIVERHPKDFCDIYSTFSLPQDTLSQIYNIDVNETNKNGVAKHQWGIIMDFAIRNTKNNKVLYGEIKRQDGWTESTDPSAGRGNAHERCCKYFTPGILNLLWNSSGLPHNILPFWLVFVGDITRDPKRNREIAFWFQNYHTNYYMWRDTSQVGDMLDFFENYLLPYLL